MKFKKICIIGLGYIGLPTAVVFARNGIEVIGVDVNKKIVDDLNQGKINIKEPKLPEEVEYLVSKGILKAQLKPTQADAFLICVPTPINDKNEADLNYVKKAALSIAKYLKKGDLVIIESTIPVNTTIEISNLLAKERKDLQFPSKSDDDSDIFIAHCPERVIPGRMLDEIIELDRIIGGISKLCLEKAIFLYEIFSKGKLLKTNSRTAELAKLTENSFRDVNIAFANEISMICDKSNIDINELIDICNLHPRVNILEPGCGVGGHCIPVDPWFIVQSFPENTDLIKSARKVNLGKKKFIVDKIINSTNRNNIKELVLLGITFKPNVDDIRESAALKIAKELIDLNFKISIIEPNLDALPENINSCDLINLSVIEDSDFLKNKLIVILVKHNQFLKYEKQIERQNYVDGCQLIKKET